MQDMCVGEESFKKKMQQWVRYWVRCFRGVGGCVAIFVAVFGIFIPSIFIALTDIPSIDKSNSSEGVLIFKKIGNNDNIFGVKNSAGVEYFSCRNQWLDSYFECFPLKQLESYKDTSVKVFWFSQKMHFFSKQKRLLSLLVDDKEIYSIDRAENDINFAKKFAFLQSFAILIIFAMVIKEYGHVINGGSNE